MKFYSIGGYNEVGKNMSAIEVGDEVVILDMGIHLDKIVTLTEEERDVPTKELIDIGALPNDSILKGKNVKAIILSHGHLDHCAAVPRMAERYGCPIIGTPFTLAIVKTLLADDGKTALQKSFRTISAGERAQISKNFEVEMVHITHSIPHSALIVLHTKEGVVTYACDYKLDNNPTFGLKPDYKRIKQLGAEGVKLHISECLRVAEEARTPPEYVAKIMVDDAIDRAYEDNTAVVITSFASHIVRLRNIIEANDGRREVSMLGRSLDSYVNSASDCGLIDSDGIKIYGRRKTIAKALEAVKQRPEDFLIIATGNQGEPNSALARLARKEFSFALRKEDQVIFSSEAIPNPINEANRYMLKRNLYEQGVRIMEHVHVSGHARREDHRDMLKMLNPQYVIPNHGETERLASFASLAMEEGWKLGDTVRIMSNGERTEIK